MLLISEIKERKEEKNTLLQFSTNPCIRMIDSELILYKIEDPRSTK